MSAATFDVNEELAEAFRDHVAFMLIGDFGTFVFPKTVNPPQRAAAGGSGHSASHEARPGTAKGDWVSVTRAATILGFGVVSFRRMIERNARRGSDGSIEASVDGVRARKLGRTWRVQLGDAWAALPTASPGRGRVVHDVGGSARHGGNEKSP